MPSFPPYGGASLDAPPMQPVGVSGLNLESSPSPISEDSVKLLFEVEQTLSTFARLFPDKADQLDDIVRQLREIVASSKTTGTSATDTGIIRPPEGY